MIREVDLISYLPPFIAEYKETNVTLTAENPEFILVWEAAERVLKNEFIETADEYGISKFELLLGIFPSRDDTLENRRTRVKSRWFLILPYTWRMFLKKLSGLCGENNFLVEMEADYYRIVLKVQLELFGQVEDLEQIIENMIPCNMVTDVTNTILVEAEGTALAAGGIRYAHFYFITNDWKEDMVVNGRIMQGGGIVQNEEYFITNDFKEQHCVPWGGASGSGVVIAEFYDESNKWKG